MTSAPRPLDGVRVVEFSHMVMGPTCGLILADLGADVVKVEPAEGGDENCRLPGSGAGIFGTYNRNKRSISVNLKSVEGLEFATDLVREADVLLENFGAGVLDRLGLGYDAERQSEEQISKAGEDEFDWFTLFWWSLEEWRSTFRSILTAETVYWAADIRK